MVFCPLQLFVEILIIVALIYAVAIKELTGTITSSPLPTSTARSIIS